MNIPQLPKREFAFTSWRKPGMIRHIGYPSEPFLYDYLIKNGPQNCYRSAAYYNKPGTDTMDTKEYQACDFVFDVDADHIPTKCRNDHNYFFCEQCGYEAKGEKPEKCPKCKNRKFKEILWICDECLEVSKQQVFKLINDFLIPEFNIPLQEINVYFSGHRGYHVQLTNPKLITIDSDGRREIIDYITGEGLDFTIWGFNKAQNNMMGFRVNQFGWPGKIARKFLQTLKMGRDYIRKIFSQPIYQKPLASSIIDYLIKSKNELINNLEQQNELWQVSGIGEKTWHQIYYILKDLIKSDVDVVVSYDIHRLIRMEGSIHGKSGFYKKKVKFASLESFDPLKDALSFPHTKENSLKIKIISNVVPPIRIEKESYGPFNMDDVVTLPLNAAIFLLCKNVAILSSD